MKKFRDISSPTRSNRGLLLKLSVFALLAMMSLFSGQTLAQTPTPTPTPGGGTCTPTTMVTEGDLFPGGVASFTITSGPGRVTVDHVNAGTGLRSLTVVGTATNATVMIPAFTPGTFDPVNVTFTTTNTNLPVDFTLRAASTFHALFIRVRCVATTCIPTTTVSEGDLFPSGTASFVVTTGTSSVTIDHVNAGTGLRMLTVVGTPTNATVNIPAFTPGTFDPVTVTFTITDPNLPVSFRLRAASTFHAAFIDVRCGAGTPTPTPTPSPTASPTPMPLSGTITNTSPTFVRPNGFNQGGTCVVSTFAAVRYTTVQVVITSTTNITLSLATADGGMVTPAGADTFLALYGPGGFNPASPCTNAIAANDDVDGTLRSRISTTTPLAPGTYTLVVTTFDNTEPLPITFTVARRNSAQPQIETAMPGKEGKF